MTELLRPVAPQGDMDRSADAWGRYHDEAAAWDAQEAAKKVRQDQVDSYVKDAETVLFAGKDPSLMARMRQAEGKYTQEGAEEFVGNIVPQVKEAYKKAGELQKTGIDIELSGRSVADYVSMKKKTGQWEEGGVEDSFLGRWGSDESNTIRKSARLIGDLRKSGKKKINTETMPIEEARSIKASFTDVDSPIKVPDDMTLEISLPGKTFEIPPRHMWEQMGGMGAGEDISAMEKVGGLGWSVSELADIRKRSNRIKDAQESGKDIFGPEYADDLERLRDLWIVEAYKQTRGKTLGAKVANTLADIPWFLVEMWAGGGASSAVRSGTEKALSGLGKGFLAQVAREGTARLLGGAARTLVTGAPRFAQGYLERTNPRAVFEGAYDARIEEARNEDGTLVSPVTAALKSLGDVAIEYITEESGDLFGKLGGGAVRKVMAKSPKFAKVIGVMKRGWEKIPGNKLKKGLEGFYEKLETVGYHGIIEEIGEERLGDAMRAALGVSDEGVLESLDPRGKGEQYLTELISFGIMGGGFAAAGKVRQWAKNNPTEAKELADIDEPSRKEFERITGILGETSKSDRAAFVAELKKPNIEVPQTKKAVEERISELRNQADNVPDSELGPIEEELIQLEGKLETFEDISKKDLPSEEKGDIIELDRRTHPELRARVEALSPENRGDLVSEIANLPEGARAERIDQLMQQVYEAQIDPVTQLPTRLAWQTLEKEGGLKG